MASKVLSKRVTKLMSFVLASMITLALLIGCQKGGKTTNGELSGRATIVGSTTLLPIIQAASEEYVKSHKEVQVDVQGGGSSVGIESVINKTASIGMCSREPTEEEMQNGLVKIPVAVDAIAIIVNPDNPVDKLTAEEARRIYGGEITNWREVGGKDEEIVVVNRDEASGTREAFAKLLMSKKDFLKKAIIQPGSGQVRSIVAGAPGAIGYLSLGYVENEVKVVALDNVRPSVANIKKERYLLRRDLYLLTKGKPKGLNKDFIDFVLSLPVQLRIVGTAYIPIIEVRD